MTRSVVRAALPLLGLVGWVGCTSLARPLDPLVADEHLLTLITGHTKDELADPAVRREIQRNWTRAHRDKRAFVELSVLARMQALGPSDPGLDAHTVVPPRCAAAAVAELWFTSDVHPWLPASTDRQVYEIVNEAVDCALAPELLGDPHAVQAARVGLWAWARAFAPAFAVAVVEDLTRITDPWIEAAQRDLDRGCQSEPGGASTDEYPQDVCLLGCEREISDLVISDYEMIDVIDDEPIGPRVWGECPRNRRTTPAIGVAINPAPVTGHARTMTLAQIGQLQHLLSRASTDERRELELGLARLWIAIELGETDPQAANAAGRRALDLLLSAVNTVGKPWRRWDEACLLAALTAWRMNLMAIVPPLLQRLINDASNPTMKHIGELLFGDLWCNEGRADFARKLWDRAEQDDDAELVATARARSCAVTPVAD